jgi:hypothetical protein
MDILSLIGWRPEAPGQPDRLQAPAFKVGDHLEGRVVRLLKQDLAVVDLLDGRFKAVAELKAPLDQGQRLLLQVTATRPRLTLQSVAGEKAGKAAAGPGSAARPSVPRPLDLSQVRDLIKEIETLAARIKGPAAAGGTPVGVALERLAAHLRPLDLEAAPGTIAARLQERVRDGGLLFEHKLAAVARQAPADLPLSAGERANLAAARPQLPLNPLLNDLKPNLQRLFLELPPLMEAMDPEQRLSETGSRQLWSTAAALLEEIEGGQRRLSEQRPDEASAALRQSLWVQGRDKALRFNVYLPGKRRKGEGGKGGAPVPVISMLLELERFGALRVDVREGAVGRTATGDALSRSEKRLRVDFWADCEPVRDHLQAALPPLANILEALYPQVDLKVSLAPEKIAAFDADAPPAAPAGSNLRKLDLRV